MRILCLGLYTFVALLISACSQPKASLGASSASASVHPTTAPSREPAVVMNAANVPSASSSAPAWEFADVRAPDRAQDARKFGFDIPALYRIKNVGGPQWSPDGSRVLFTVVAHDLAAGKSDRDIYVVRSDGTDLRQLTRFEGFDGSARWSPDGKSFLLVSTRSGSEQIWLMPADGGEPRALTHISTGVDNPIWSGDGKWIAFASRVFPAYGADDAANKALLDDMAKSPIQAHIADELLLRHWDSYADGTRSHILLMEVASGKITDVTPGDFESPVWEPGGGRGFSFSPDSSEICFGSNREDPSAQAWTTNADLWTQSLRGGPATPLTASNRAFDGDPQYSPDGRYIAFLRQETPGHEADRMRLALYDRSTGKITVITEGFDSWVHEFVWAADARSIVFRAPVEGRFPLFRVRIADGAIERIGSIPSVGDFDLSSSGQIAFTNSAVGTPPEIYVGNGDGTAIHRVSAFNTELADKTDIRPVEETWVDGADGVKVHVFIVKPHGFVKGKRYPLILNVHGGPQSQWSDSFRGDWQVYPGAGYVVAFPNPHGSTGYGQAYTSAISKDWGGKVYQDVMAVTDALANMDFVDASRMGAMGWSWGGYMMNWLLGHTDRFKALASMMGVFDLRALYGSTEELWWPEWDIGGSPWESPQAYEKFSPSGFASNFKTPTLIVSGEKDYRIPYTQSLQLFTTLRRKGVAARLVLFANEGHWPSPKSMPLYYAAHLDWFHRYLGGAPSALDPLLIARGRAFKKR
jgi:dipeptidyl aminopeptidase/acylaminoacyl peptidase